MIALHLPFGDRVFHRAWSPWDLPVSTANTGVTDTRHSAWLFMSVLEFEPRSSFLQGRYSFTGHLPSPYKMVWVLPTPPGGCPLPSPSSSAQSKPGHIPRTPNVHSDILGTSIGKHKFPGHWDNVCRGTLPATYVSLTRCFPVRMRTNPMSASLSSW